MAKYVTEKQNPRGVMAKRETPGTMVTYPVEAYQKPAEEVLDEEGGTESVLAGPEGIADEAGIALSDEELQGTFTALAEEAIAYSEELSQERAKLSKYYEGTLPAPDPEDSRSKVVIRTFADVMNRVLPAIMRVFFGGERYVEFRPTSERTVELAKQQTAYIDGVVIKEDNRGFTQYYNAFHDALRKRLGVMTWWYDERMRSETYKETLVSMDRVTEMKADPDIRIRTIRKSKLSDQMYDVMFTRNFDESKTRFEAVPPEEFLTSRKPRDIFASPLVGRRTQLRTSELLDMGVPQSWIDQYGGTSEALTQTQEAQERGNTRSVQGLADQALPKRALHEKNDWIEAIITLPYVDIDEGQEASSGLFIIKALGPSMKVIEATPTDEIPYATFVPDPEPHSLEGRGLGDKTIDLQEVMTFIARSMNNSLALSIQNRLGYVEGEVDADDIESHEIGRTIRMQKPGMIQEIGHDFKGREALNVLAFYDEMVTSRTGADKNSAALTADAFQSTTPAGVAETISLAQLGIEMIARHFAETGIRQLMRGLLKNVIEHPRPDRVMRLQGKWVPVDTEAWDTSLDLTVNVALGAGLVEQRYAALAASAQVQQAILTTLGLTQPLVTPATFSEHQRRMLRLRGFVDAEQLWPEPDPNWQPPQPQPDANMALVQVEAQRVAAEAADKSRKADLDRQQTQIEEMRKAMDMELQREEMHLKDDLERDRLEADIAIRIATAQAQFGADITEQQVQSYMQVGETRARLAAEREQMYLDHKAKLHKINTDAAASVATATAQPAESDAGTEGD